MPRIPRTAQSVSAQGQPLPHSTGDGYQAVGRATQQLGRSIASAGKSIAGALGGAQEDAERHEMFNAKLDLTNFQGEQTRFQAEYDGGITGDGTGHVELRDQSYNNAFDTSIRSKYANASPRVRQFVEQSGASLRQNYLNKSTKQAMRQRQVFYAESTQNMLETQVLPQITGETDSLEAALQASDRIVDGVPSTDLNMINDLRSKSAEAIYKTWKEKAGPDAFSIGQEIAGQYQAGLKKQTPLGEIFKDRVPSPSERRAIFRKGGVVINLDTNWGKGDGQTTPMVVIPDGASDAQRAAAEAYAKGVADIYAKQFGKSLEPRVVTRSENGRGRAATMHTEPYAVTDTKAAEFFNSPEGRRAHAEILRSTLGQLPGARFSIPHDPFGKGDKGAEGKLGNEVDFARGLIEELEGTTGGFVPPDASVATRFASLVTKELPSLEKYAQRALKAKEAAEDAQDRAIREEVDKTMTDLAVEGELTEDMVETYRPLLSASRYRQLMTKVTKGDSATNVETWRDLYDRSHFEPSKVREEARTAFEQGLLSASDYKDLIRRTQAPPMVREMKSLLRTKLKPPADSDEVERKAYFEALEDFDKYVDDQGDGMKRTDLYRYVEDRIKQAKTQMGSQSRRRLQRMRFSDVSREATDMETLEQSWEATKEAYGRKEIGLKEYTRQYKLYKNWQKTLMQEGEGRGERVKPPKKQGGALGGMPGVAQGMLESGTQIPGAQVKGSMETQPNTVEQTPETFSAAAEQMLQSGAQIPPELVQRGLITPGGIMSDGSFDPMVLPEVLNIPREAIIKMLTPGYDYSDTDQASRDSFDAAGAITTGGLGATAAGAVPKGAVGSAGGVLAKQSARNVDGLGYFSKLDEVLNTFSDKDQITAKALQERGVKASEIEARGLAGALAEGPKPAGELRQVAQANPVEIRETSYGIPRNADAIRARIEEINKQVESLPKPVNSPENMPVFAPLRDEWERLNNQLTTQAQPKWQSYSLDPDNPTYRETVLHLPPTKKKIEQWKVIRPDEWGGKTRGNYDDEATARARAEPGDTVFHDAPIVVDGGFKSGHWKETNAIAHARTSMNTTPDGRKAFLVDELQSDWGQKIRDAGGPMANDAADRASARMRELKSELAAHPSMTDEVKEKTARALTGRSFHTLSEDIKANVIMDIASSSSDAGVRQLFDEVLLREAESFGAGPSLPGHPLVNTTDQWVNTAMRQLIKQAIDEGADVIAIPSGKTVQSFGMGGKAEGLNYAYDQMYPKNMRKILSKMDKSITPERVNTLTSASGKGGLGQGFTIFPITDRVREAVSKGQPLFATGSPAASAVSVENKRRGN